LLNIIDNFESNPIKDNKNNCSKKLCELKNDSEEDSKQDTLKYCESKNV
jgi:hypothetical protein